jgi:hypothetical protein
MEIPFHASDSSIVCLKNSFKIKGQSIPEGEFSTRSSSYQSPSFRSPSEIRLENRIALIGHLTLLVDVCINFVGMLEIGFE